MFLEQNVEFAKNPEPRCPVVLLLDTSASMDGERIRQLNNGILTFKREVEKDSVASLRVEVAIIAFNDSAEVIQDFITIDDFFPPTLTAEGTTAMGMSIETALNILEERKSAYRSNGIPYYQPWVLLITDGEPNEGWQNAAMRAKKADAEQKLTFFVVGVQGANIKTLRNIAPSARPPVMLQGLKFEELFRWLSGSLRKVSSNQVGGQVELPPITGWAQVNT